MKIIGPCPFCKSRCTTLWTETDGNNVVTDAWVECDDCHARGPACDSPDETVDKWNGATETKG